jgi:hypothetical protein
MIMSDSARLVYIRDENKFPVGCIAFKVNGDVIQFGYSIWNPKDKYNRSIARKIAMGRLEGKKDKQPSECTCAYTGTKSIHDVMRSLFTTLSLRTDLPKRIRRSLLSMRNNLYKKNV